MGQELEPKDEFMHKLGDFFISYGKVHVLARVRHGFTPADSECEDYWAICGIESQSWSMPSQGIKGAEFINSLENGEKEGAKRCEICLPKPVPKEIPGEEGLPPPELIVMLQDLANRCIGTQRETPGAIEKRSAEVKEQAFDILASFGEAHHSGDSGEDPHLRNLYGLFYYRAIPPVKVTIEGNEIFLELMEVFRYDHVIEHEVLDTIAVRAGVWGLRAEHRDLFKIEREGYIHTLNRIERHIVDIPATELFTSTRATLREINTLSKVLAFINSSLSVQRRSSDSPTGFS